MVLAPLAHVHARLSIRNSSFPEGGKLSLFFFFAYLNGFFLPTLTTTTHSHDLTHQQRRSTIGHQFSISSGTHRRQAAGKIDIEYRMRQNDVLDSIWPIGASETRRALLNHPHPARARVRDALGHLLLSHTHHVRVFCIRVCMYVSLLNEAIGMLV